MGKKKDWRNKRKGSIKMAQVFEATPSIKGFEAVKLIKSVMTSKVDYEKVEKLDRLSRRIESYRK